ncbi:MAG: 23S rRNA pseudouridylate synthase B, partial [Telluria sp.]
MKPTEANEQPVEALEGAAAKPKRTRKAAAVVADAPEAVEAAAKPKRTRKTAAAAAPAEAVDTPAAADAPAAKPRAAKA